MSVDILIIVGIVVFTIIGTITKLNKPSRGIVSLCLSLGVSVFTMYILDTFLFSFVWYQELKGWTSSNYTLNIVLYFFILITVALVASLIIRLILKGIELVIKDTGRFIPSICGALISLTSGFVCAIAVLQICAYLNVNIDAPMFEELLTTLQNIKA